jgi:mono/diheme cytochrome c family protein
MFFQAFFNPLFWPSLFIRILACISLAGVWALLTCSRIDASKSPGLKRSLVRWSAKWLMPAFVLMPLCVFFFLWQLPASQKILLQLGLSTIGVGAFTQLTRTVLIIVISSATIVGVVYFFAYSFPLEFKPAQALVVLVLALAVVASTEYSREMLRKPFVIGQHMYSNGIRVSSAGNINTNGFLTASLWTRQTNDAGLNLAKGEAICRGQCLSCHTIDGYRSMRKLLSWRNRESIDSVLTMLNEYKPESQFRKYMPPLVGTKEEIQALGDYLASLNPAASAVNQQASK